MMLVAILIACLAVVANGATIHHVITENSTQVSNTSTVCKYKVWYLDICDPTTKIQTAHLILTEGSSNCDVTRHLKKDCTPNQENDHPLVPKNALLKSLLLSANHSRTTLEVFLNKTDPLKLPPVMRPGSVTRETAKNKILEELKNFEEQEDKTLNIHEPHRSHKPKSFDTLFQFSSSTGNFPTSPSEKNFSGGSVTMEQKKSKASSVLRSLLSETTTTKNPTKDFDILKQIMQDLTPEAPLEGPGGKADRVLANNKREEIERRQHEAEQKILGFLEPERVLKRDDGPGVSLSADLSEVSRERVTGANEKKKKKHKFTPVEYKRKGAAIVQSERAMEQRQDLKSEQPEQSATTEQPVVKKVADNRAALSLSTGVTNSSDVVITADGDGTPFSLEVSANGSSNNETEKEIDKHRHDAETEVLKMLESVGEGDETPTVSSMPLSTSTPSSTTIASRPSTSSTNFLISLSSKSPLPTVPSSIPKITQAPSTTPVLLSSSTTGSQVKHESGIELPVGSSLSVDLLDNGSVSKTVSNMSTGKNGSETVKTSDLQETAIENLKSGDIDREFVDEKIFDVDEKIVDVDKKIDGASIKNIIDDKKTVGVSKSNVDKNFDLRNNFVDSEEEVIRPIDRNESIDDSSSSEESEPMSILKNSKKFEGLAGLLLDSATTTSSPKDLPILQPNGRAWFPTSGGLNKTGNIMTSLEEQKLLESQLLSETETPLTGDSSSSFQMDTSKPSQVNLDLVSAAKELEDEALLKKHLSGVLNDKSRSSKPHLTTSRLDPAVLSITPVTGAPSLAQGDTLKVPGSLMPQSSSLSSNDNSMKIRSKTEALLDKELTKPNFEEGRITIQGSPKQSPEKVALPSAYSYLRTLTKPIQYNSTNFMETGNGQVQINRTDFQPETDDKFELDQKLLMDQLHQVTNINRLSGKPNNLGRKSKTKIFRENLLGLMTDRAVQENATTESLEHLKNSSLLTKLIESNKKEEIAKQVNTIEEILKTFATYNQTIPGDDLNRIRKIVLSPNFPSKKRDEILAILDNLTKEMLKTYREREKQVGSNESPESLEPIFGKNGFARQHLNLVKPTSNASTISVKDHDLGINKTRSHLDLERERRINETRESIHKKLVNEILNEVGSMSDPGVVKPASDNKQPQGRGRITRPNASDLPKETKRSRSEFSEHNFDPNYQISSSGYGKMHSRFINWHIENKPDGKQTIIVL